MFDLRQIFQMPLFDLGTSDEELRGILTPRYDEDHVAKFITDYYSDRNSAMKQSREIFMDDYYKKHLLRTFESINYPLDRVKTVVDIGSGFGSTVVPMLSLMPQSQVIASDLSLGMLYALRRRLAPEMSHRCHLMQLDAEGLYFKDNSIDIAIGAAVLHHLHDPEKSIELCSKILKPGGIAIFFEPFANGYSIISLIYQEILDTTIASRPVRDYLVNCINTWRKMMFLEPSDPFFLEVDDKWLFNKQFFYDLQDKYSFKRLLINPVDILDNPFLERIKVHLSGNGISDFPDSAWKIIRKYEDHFPPVLKNDLLTEGIIVFMK